MAKTRGFARYIGTKLVFLIVTYIIAITIVFILPRAIPGNPVASLLVQMYQRAQSNPEQVQSVYITMIEEFGIGKPWYEQYINFLSRMMRGDLGTSITRYPKKVIELIVEPLTWTLALLLPATIISWYLGNLLGVVAAYKRNTWIDRVISITVAILSQIPYYWFGMMLIYVFAIQLNIFPSGLAYSPTLIPSLSYRFIVDVLWHYVLPFLSIVIVSLGGWALSMRNLAVIEVTSDYINYVKLLGAKDSVIFRYIYRNSLLPQVTGLALALGNIISGQILTEIVFKYPGMGYVLATSIARLDYPVIQGIFVMLIATLYLANFLVDFVYALIDPRIRLGGETY